MRYITSTFMSALLVCVVNAQQTNQTAQKVKPQSTLTTNAKPAVQKSQMPQKLKEMTATRAVICLNINDHEPEDVGESFPPHVKRLYCFTEIQSSGESAEIQHRWYWKDELMGTMPLKINSARFRTYSAKSIPATATGDWRVAVVNSHNEEVIQIIKFMIE